MVTFIKGGRYVLFRRKMSNTNKKMSKEFIAEFNRIAQKNISCYYQITNTAIYKVKKMAYYHIGDEFLSLTDEEKVMYVKSFFLPITLLFV
jgi:hypothetical protein